VALSGSCLWRGSSLHRPSTTGSAHRCRRPSLGYPTPFDCAWSWFCRSSSPPLARMPSHSDYPLRRWPPEGVRLASVANLPLPLCSLVSFFRFFRCLLLPCTHCISFYLFVRTWACQATFVKYNKRWGFFPPSTSKKKDYDCYHISHMLNAIFLVKAMGQKK
jgi:hypothetical protein